MQRLREFDFMRAAAALSVIAIHVTGIYVYNSRAAYGWNQAMRYAVPLFIILSGLLLANSDKGKEAVKYSEFIQKRFKKILTPYLLWTIIYVLFNLRGKFQEAFSNITQFAGSFGKNLLYGTGELHLYFIIIILQMYLFYPLLLKMLKRWETGTLIVSFCITFYFQLGIYLQNIKVARILPKAWPLPYYESFWPWLFFFVFGMFAAGHLDRWKLKLLHHKGLLTAVWALSFVLLIIDSILTKTNADSIKPTVMLYCGTSFFFFYIMATLYKDTESSLGKILDWFSKQSFMIYLSHLLVQTVLRGAVNKIGLPKLWNGSCGMVLLYIATVASTILLVYLVSLTPAAAWLGGVPEKTKPSLYEGKKKANIDL